MKSYENPRFFQVFSHPKLPPGLREGRGRPGGGLCPHSWQLCGGIRLGRCVGKIVVIRGENHGKMGKSWEIAMKNMENHGKSWEIAMKIMENQGKPFVEIQGHFLRKSSDISDHFSVVPGKP